MVSAVDRFAWRQTDGESAHPSNDGGARMSDRALRIIGCDIGPGRDQCAPGFRSTAATLLNKEGAFDSNGGSRSRALHGEKSAGAPWRRQLDKGGKNKTYGIYGPAAYCAERVRLMQHLANCLYNLRDGVFAVSLRRSAAWPALVSILGSEA